MTDDSADNGGSTSSSPSNPSDSSDQSYSAGQSKTSNQSEIDESGKNEDEDENENEVEREDTDSTEERSTATDEVSDDVRQYDRFKKIDGSQYDRANQFLRDRTYITAREWAIARLCADFRTETGVEMTKIGENLPDLVPFMEDTYTPQAVNQARSAFEEKIRTAGATFLYGAMCDFFTAEELDDIMYESTEVAKFLLEVEGVDLSVEEELEAEERISSVMREVREASAELREEELEE